jgi:hypothetical protein
MAKSLRSRDNPTLATDLTNELECLKWFVWYGSVFRAPQVVDDLEVEHASPEQRTLPKTVTEFGGSIRANATSIPELRGEVSE